MSMMSEQIKILKNAANAAESDGFSAMASVLRSAAHYHNGWIPCNKRLPEEYGEYLCVSEYGKFMLGMPDWNEKCGYFAKTNSQIMYDAIAWMPLPEPYKEGNNED